MMINNSRTRSGEGGFTLLELLVTLAIFSIGMLGVIGMYVAAIKGNGQGKNMTEATTLAQSRLSRLLTSVPYDNLEVYAVDEANLNPDETSNGIYTRSTSILNPYSSYDIKQINVSVSWQSKSMDEQFHTHKVELSTIRAKDR